jgi:hypothetical protein
MHAEIARTDQILRDGLSTLRAHFLSQGYSVLAHVPPAAPPKVRGALDQRLFEEHG